MNSTKAFHWLPLVLRRCRSDRSGDSDLLLAGNLSLTLKEFVPSGLRRLPDGMGETDPKEPIESGGQSNQSFKEP
jgi:hypothetical protein